MSNPLNLPDQEGMEDPPEDQPTPYQPGDPAGMPEPENPEPPPQPPTPEPEEQEDDEEEADEED